MAQTINIIFGATSVGGTADAITAVYSPVLTALTNRRTLSFKAAANNTGAVTFSPDGLTVRSVTKRGGTALIAGDILQNAVYFIQYDSTNTRWELINPSTDNNVIPTLAQVLTNGNQANQDIDMNANSLQNTSFIGTGNSVIDMGGGLYLAITTDAGVYATPYLYLQPSVSAVLSYSANDLVSIVPALLNVLHSARINLDSPEINLPNETASRYLFLDASKNIDTKTTAQVLSDIGAQPLDTQLTEIAALNPSNDDIIQEKAGVLTNRTMAQLGADLTASNLIGYQGYALQGGHANTNYADNATYFFGSFPDISAQNGASTIRQINFPKSGTIVMIKTFIYIQTTLGSNEATSLYLRINDTTDTLLTSALDLSIRSQVITNAVSISVTDSDYWEGKIVCPVNYVTNPTNVRISMVVYIQ